MTESFRLNNQEITYNSFLEKYNKGELSSAKLQSFLSIFDTDGSGILETSNSTGQNELKNIWQSLKETAGEDSNLEESEFQTLLQTKNLLTDKAKEMFVSLKNIFSKPETSSPQTRIETIENENGKTEKTFVDNKLTKEIIEQDGLRIETDYQFDEETGILYRLQQTVTIDNQTITVKYDGKGNTDGVVVQIQPKSETPQSIAKLFGCSVEDLIELNKDNGRKDKIYRNSNGEYYFLAGAQIRIPGEFDGFDERILNRFSSEEVSSQYNNLAADVWEETLGKYEYYNVNILTLPNLSSVKTFEDLAKILFEVQGKENANALEIDQYVQFLKKTVVDKDGNKIPENKLAEFLATGKDIYVPMDPEYINKTELARYNAEVSGYEQTSEVNRNSRTYSGQITQIVNNLSGWLSKSDSLSEQGFINQIAQINRDNVLDIAIRYKEQTGRDLFVDIMNLGSVWDDANGMTIGDKHYNKKAPESVARYYVQQVVDALIKNDMSDIANELVAVYNSNSELDSVKISQVNNQINIRLGILTSHRITGNTPQVSSEINYNYTYDDMMALKTALDAGSSLQDSYRQIWDESRQEDTVFINVGNFVASNMYHCRSKDEINQLLNDASGYRTECINLYNEAVGLWNQLQEIPKDSPDYERLKNEFNKAMGKAIREYELTACTSFRNCQQQYEGYKTALEKYSTAYGLARLVNTNKEMLKILSGYFDNKKGSGTPTERYNQAVREIVIHSLGGPEAVKNLSEAQINEYINKFLESVNTWAQRSNTEFHLDMSGESDAKVASNMSALWNYVDFLCIKADSEYESFLGDKQLSDLEAELQACQTGLYGDMNTSTIVTNYDQILKQTGAYTGLAFEFAVAIGLTVATAGLGAGLATTNLARSSVTVGRVAQGLTTYGNTLSKYRSLQIINAMGCNSTASLVTSYLGNYSGAEATERVQFAALSGFLGSSAGIIAKSNLVQGTITRLTSRFSGVATEATETLLNIAGSATIDPLYSLSDASIDVVLDSMFNHIGGSGVSTSKGFEPIMDNNGAQIGFQRLSVDTKTNNLIVEIIDNNNNPLQKIEYKRDSQGNNIGSIVYDNSGIRVRESITNNGVTTVIDYDQYGRKAGVQNITIDSNNGVSTTVYKSASGEIISTEIQTLGENGLPAKREIRDKDGNITIMEERVYNDKGLVTQIIEYEADGTTVKNVTNLSYDENNNLVDAKVMNRNEFVLGDSDIIIDDDVIIGEPVNESEIILDDIELPVFGPENIELYDKITSATTPEDFRIISEQIQSMPESPERTSLFECYIEKRYPQFTNLSSDKNLLQMFNSYKEQVSYNEIDFMNAVDRMYEHACKMGAKDLVDNNPEFFNSLFLGCRKVDGQLISDFECLGENEFEVIRYAMEQTKNGKFDATVIEAFNDRVDDGYPIELFEYINTPDSEFPQDFKYTVDGYEIAQPREWCLRRLNCIRIIDNVLATQNIPRDITVSRVEDIGRAAKFIKIGDKTFEELLKTHSPQQILEMLNDPNIISENTYNMFIGTSIGSQAHFKGDIEWKINVPEGSNGAYISDICDSNNEREFLLQRGTTLKITKAEYKNGVWYFEADAIQTHTHQNDIQIAEPIDGNPAAIGYDVEGILVGELVEGEFDVNTIVEPEIEVEAPELALSHEQYQVLSASSNQELILDLITNSRYAKNTKTLKLIDECLNKYPEYASEIVEILKQNPNIKIGTDLNGNQSNHIDNVVSIIKSNPKYKDEIVEFMNVQRKGLHDTSDPTEPLKSYVELLNQYPGMKGVLKKLAKNPNLTIDGMRDLIDIIQTDDSNIDVVLLLSSKNYDITGIRRYLNDLKKYPQIIDNLLIDIPTYNFIDPNPTQEIQQRRDEIKQQLVEICPDELKELKTTLGETFFNYVSWENIIPNNATNQEIKNILSDLNDSSKFFARLVTNERRYGKNINWATNMRIISDNAQIRINSGASFDDIINGIANDYHNYDISNSLESNNSADPTDRRTLSGFDRRGNNPNSWAHTPYNEDGYSEYLDRYAQICQNGQLPKPAYPNCGQTTLTYDPTTNSGYMNHPETKYINPTLNHARKAYEDISPLIQKVQNGGTLTPQERELFDNKVAEIYYLVANVMPWSRGTNGISDIFLRSVYKSINVDLPAIKQNVSLDLEAFSMDLETYKQKWNSFFEQ